MESLTELRERRAFQCRLAPGRALRSLEEADAFLRDRGLLTRTADCALPTAAGPGCWIILPPRGHPASRTCAPSSGSNGRN